MEKIDPRTIISPMHALFCSWLEELDDDDMKDTQMPKRKKPDHHAVIARYTKEKSSDRAASIENQLKTYGDASDPQI